MKLEAGASALASSISGKHMAKKPKAVEADEAVDTAVEVEAVEAPVAETKPDAPLFVVSAKGNPSLAALNRRSHEVGSNVEEARKAALAAAQRAVEDLFRKV
jgi:hypothetical protein